MANPLDAFKNLKPWQQGAVAVGGVGVVGLVVWQHQKSKKATPAIPAATPAGAAASGVASTAGEIEDPTTGQYYPDGEVDSQTGLTYQQEIAEYGSVSAADAANSSVGNQAALQGITPQEYVEQTGGTGTTATTGSTVTTNAQWMAEVETGLSEQNYTASDIGQGIAAYFASKPLGTSSDGTNLYTMMSLAISEYGPPPVGSYPLLMGGKTPIPTAPKVTVPNVTGVDVEQAKQILDAAGLKASGPAGVKDKLHVVTSTTPAAGTKVASGTTVTLKYKTESEAPPKAKK